GIRPVAPSLERKSSRECFRNKRVNGPRRSKPRLQRPGIRRELLALVNGESERQITGLGMREIGPRKHKNTKSTAHKTKAKPRISRSDTEKQSSLSLREAVFVFSCFRGPIAVRMSWEPRVNRGEHGCLV